MSYSLSYYANLNKTAFLFLLDYAKQINNQTLINFLTQLFTRNHLIMFNKAGNIRHMLCPFHEDKNWNSVYGKDGKCICYACGTVFNFYDLLTKAKINQAWKELSVDFNDLLTFINNNTIFAQTYPDLFYAINNKHSYLQADFLNTLLVISNLTNNEAIKQDTYARLGFRGFKNQTFINNIGAFSVIGGYDQIKNSFLDSFTRLENTNTFIKPDSSYIFTYDKFVQIATTFQLLNDTTRQSILYNRLVIPLKNQTGQIVNLDMRSTTKTPYLTRYLFLKQNIETKNLSDVLKTLNSNNSNLIGLLDLNDNKNSDLLYLNEGIFDTLSLQYFGLKAGCIFSSNITSHQLEQIYTLSQKNTIVLALDNDKAGISGMLKACELLVLKGICNPNVILVPVIEEVKDWNDVLKNTQKGDVDVYHMPNWNTWYSKEEEGRGEKNNLLFVLINHFLLDEFRTHHYVSYFKFLCCLTLLKLNYTKTTSLPKNFILQNYFTNDIDVSYELVIDEFFSKLMFLDVVRSNSDLSADLVFLQDINTNWLTYSKYADELKLIFNPQYFLTWLNKNLISNYNTFLQQEKFLHRFNNQKFGIDANQKKYYTISYKNNRLKKKKENGR